MPHAPSSQKRSRDRDCAIVCSGVFRRRSHLILPMRKRFAVRTVDRFDELNVEFHFKASPHFVVFRSAPRRRMTTVEMPEV